MSRARHTAWRSLPIVGGVMLLVAAVIVLLVARAVTTPPPWDPLYGPPAAQAILDQDENGLNVEGQKCNREDYPVLVEGTIYAQQVIPAGSSIELTSGRSVRVPGCTTTVFENEYPPKLTERTRQISGSVIWYRFGVERAVGECESETHPVPAGVEPFTVTGRVANEPREFQCWDREPSVTWTWQTENFTLPHVESGGNGD